MTQFRHSVTHWYYPNLNFDINSVYHRFIQYSILLLNKFHINFQYFYLLRSFTDVCSQTNSLTHSCTAYSITHTPAHSQSLTHQPTHSAYSITHITTHSQLLTHQPTHSAYSVTHITTPSQSLTQPTHSFILNHSHTNS